MVNTIGKTASEYGKVEVLEWALGKGIVWNEVTCLCCNGCGRMIVPGTVASSPVLHREDMIMSWIGQERMAVQNLTKMMSWKNNYNMERD